MSRPRSRILWGQLALVLPLVLSGCATRPTLPPRTLSAEQQRSLLQGLASFTFTGRVRISGQDSMPSMEWRQQRNVSKLKLNNPLGTGGLRLEYSPGRLQLMTGRGERREGHEAEQALASAIGFVPPFDSLRYWVLGVPDPGAATPMEILDADGLLQRLQQQDWTISYESRAAVNTPAGVVHLPRKLLATSDNLKLTLVIDRWRIDE